MSETYLEKSKIFANNAKSKILDTYIYPINKFPRNRIDIERMT